MKPLMALTGARLVLDGGGAFIEAEIRAGQGRRVVRLPVWSAAELIEALVRQVAMPELRPEPGGHRIAANLGAALDEARPLLEAAELTRSTDAAACYEAAIAVLAERGEG